MEKWVFVTGRPYPTAGPCGRNSSSGLEHRMSPSHTYPSVGRHRSDMYLQTSLLPKSRTVLRGWEKHEVRKSHRALKYYFNVNDGMWD